MIPSREFIEGAAAQTGYQASSLEKVIILGDLAGDIARHPLLKSLKVVPASINQPCNYATKLHNYNNHAMMIFH